MDRNTKTIMAATAIGVAVGLVLSSALGHPVLTALGAGVGIACGAVYSNQQGR